MSCERLETGLLNEASRTASKFKTVKIGRNKKNFDYKVKNITVLQEELQQLQLLTPRTLCTPSTSVQAPGTPGAPSTIPGTPCTPCTNQPFFLKR